MKQYVNFEDKDHAQSFEIALEEIVKAGASQSLLADLAFADVRQLLCDSKELSAM